MAFIKTGENKIIIGVDELLVYCPSCESAQWSDIMVTGKYFHLYWIPILPVDKEVNIICRNCGLKRYGLPFNQKVFSDYEEIKSRFPHPWFNYIGIGVVILFVLVMLLTQLLKNS
jgi:hypothetical protein